MHAKAVTTRHGKRYDAIKSLRKLRNKSKENRIIKLGTKSTVVGTLSTVEGTLSTVVGALPHKKNKQGNCSHK